jgi:hypothetical protein
MQRQPYLTRRRVDDSRVVVRLEGEHDATSAVRVGRELDEVFRSGADAIIDLSDRSSSIPASSACSYTLTGWPRHRLT